MPAFHLTGFYLEDKAFTPIPRARAGSADRKGRSRSTSSASFPTPLPSSWPASGPRSPRSPRCSATALLPTTYFFTLRHGVDPRSEAKALESAFLANGMQADSLQKLLDDVVAGSLTFDRLIMGFMGLGLIVGVAALGVISARSVVERRQQIGVLRAIGFRKRMVQACFLLESSFIALTSIFIGTALGVVVGHNSSRPRHHQGPGHNTLRRRGRGAAVRPDRLNQTAERS